jgi:hypothetical protein
MVAAFMSGIAFGLAQLFGVWVGRDAGASFEDIRLRQSFLHSEDVAASWQPELRAIVAVPRPSRETAGAHSSGNESAALVGGLQAHSCSPAHPGDAASVPGSSNRREDVLRREPPCGCRYSPSSLSRPRLGMGFAIEPDEARDRPGPADDEADDQPPKRGLMIPASMGLRFSTATPVAAEGRPKSAAVSPSRASRANLSTVTGFHLDRPAPARRGPKGGG